MKEWPALIKCLELFSLNSSCRIAFFCIYELLLRHNLFQNIEEIYRNVGNGAKKLYFLFSHIYIDIFHSFVVLKTCIFSKRLQEVTQSTPPCPVRRRIIISRVILIWFISLQRDRFCSPPRQPKQLLHFP